MRNIFTLAIVLVALVACSMNKASKDAQTAINSKKLVGFWHIVQSDYDFKKALESMRCLDPEWMATYGPQALGSHFLVRADSILFFQYPYQYLGCAQYEILGDSLFLKSDSRKADKFSTRIAHEDSLFLNFQERINNACVIIAEASYERIVPDEKVIAQLLRDSVSYAPMVGQWWHLRKEIGYDDGSEPTILPFPKGMPDSIFVTKEIISRNSPKPYLDLKLNRRNVRMLFEDPEEYSFSLRPEDPSDKILFSGYYDYGGGSMDTIYYDVVYYKPWQE